MQLKIVNLINNKEIPFLLTLTNKDEITLLINPKDVLNNNDNNSLLLKDNPNMGIKIEEDKTSGNTKIKINSGIVDNTKSHVLPTPNAERQIMIISQKEAEINPHLAEEINNFFKEGYEFTTSELKTLKDSYTRELKTLESQFMNGCPSCKRNGLKNKYLTLLHNYFQRNSKVIEIK